MRSNKLKPLVIGDITIEHPLALAPMAGVTDLPYRLLCKEQGAGMMCTEMVSAKGLYYGNRKSEPLMATDPEGNSSSDPDFWIRSRDHGSDGSESQ